ncbi:L,D-transpeptidase family protein [Maribellus sp. YY47]|uniref:L,D-transpeptidase family protein n=1 Tax=Maribellus sp. YY47 TaxID=2929486 RepID=UPI0020009ABB|nr:L,D-transpeptidase family protein [Maribellus sp. YY47]MCK3682720.1 L,D-transpeptidase family protein [Maribellus sp. YY47]
MEQILKVQESSIPANVSQLLVVIAEQSGNAQVNLFALEKADEKWEIKSGPFAAGIGRNGFAAMGEKMEGDGKSPSGIFYLGHLFTYADTVETKMPFTLSTDGDKWIDDPESEDYNKHVRGETTAKSYENLKLKSNYYKYCMVIEYNTDPVVKGKGSAIFFHLRESDTETTSGCVAVSEKDMVQVLKWLDPACRPMIVMGDRQTLLNLPVQ